jgi:cyclopropane fatty-acyl-phospholipid synthase-like methyltransferase
MKFAKLLMAACLVAIPFAAHGQDKEDKVTCRIIYVPTEQTVVEKMLDMAKVTKKDVVFDLGCGDGRVVCTAAKNFGAKGVGVDIDPERI